jgi:signal transduction histidine kinase
MDPRALRVGCRNSFSCGVECPGIHIAACKHTIVGPEMAGRAAQTDLARQAASDERRRIAREIHDVVAHSLTVTMLHLTAARYILSRDPEGAAAALADAERLGRQSLADVRRTVGLLAGEGAVNSATLAPLPGADDIPTLVADYARAGLDAHYTRSGEAFELPAAGLALYRIAQEALANVAKHAPGAHVSVRLRTEADVLLQVSDDGVRDAVDQDSRSTDAGSGLGLLGMRERALLLRGTLTAGPADNGCGWSVECRLPGAAAAR